MANDPIDNQGFECFYTCQEILGQQCQLLIDETNHAWLEVRGARQNIAEEVMVNTQLHIELTGLKNAELFTSHNSTYYVPPLINWRFDMLGE